MEARASVTKQSVEERVFMNETAIISEPHNLSRRSTVRLTTAQALVRYLAGLRTRVEGPQGDEIVPLFGGVFAIFGHGNVAALGEALYQNRDRLPTYRAHNEQAMAHAAIAYAKAHFRRRMMACTSSIGPGATNFPSESVRQAHAAYLRGKEHQKR
jgi:TPP-dependent trihydroxycyclohexane-1,2-dione (THcHDO) dehydratase